MTNWQDLLKELQRLLEQSITPQETFEATEAACVRLVQRTKEIQRVLHSMGESDLGMFVERIVVLATTYEVSSHQPTLDEVKKYLGQLKFVSTNMIPAILASKENIASQNEKLFEYLQGHIKQAFEARKRMVR